MSRSLSYADAAALMSEADPALVRALDTALGGALLAATAGGSELALSLFDAKSELTRLSERLARGLSTKLDRLNRLDRTDRLHAAHTVIVLTSFFDALSSIDLPFRPNLLELTRARQATLASGQPAAGDDLADIVHLLRDSDLPALSPTMTVTETLDNLRLCYRRLGDRMLVYVSGLAVWDPLTQTAREHCRQAMQERLPAVASSRYEAQLRRLATDFPELSFYLSRADHEATRRHLRALSRSLTEVHALLAGDHNGLAPNPTRDALTRRYTAQLDRPIVESGDVPADLQLPTLSEAYIDPDFRVAAVNTSDPLHLEEFWATRELQQNLSGFLVALLSSRECTHRPLIVLGQPGSGKSVLTRILAGRLPPGDFLTVQVKLRQTPAEADIQTQVEHAIRQDTGESRSWPEVSREAGGALRVVILDGFDELLQATGVSRSNYLEQVAAFQEREADQGRPVAVIVTSRVSVADRASIPKPGAIALYLNTFRDPHVEAWLTVWNAANRSSLQRRRLHPLPVAAVLAHPDLARQPLLLLLLAIYDAADNELQRHSANITRADLYERLLGLFARREVAKDTPNLDAARARVAVDKELHRLSLTAMGMFHRGRQWVTLTELDSDLHSLLSDPTLERRDFQAPLSSAEILIGQFFFVHRIRSLQAGLGLTAFEFLHATFGEYLVARLVAGELIAVATVSELDLGRARAPQLNTDLLLDALAFEPLTARAVIVDSLRAMLATFTPERRSALTSALLEMFQSVSTGASGTSATGYRPRAQTAAGRQAMQSANLLLLLVAVNGRALASDLFGAKADPVRAWRSHALLWQSQSSEEGWRSLVSALGVTRLTSGNDREIEVTFQPNDWIPAPIDPLWSSTRDLEGTEQPFGWSHEPMGHLFRVGSFLCDPFTDAGLHAVEGLDAQQFGEVAGPRLTNSFVALRSGRRVSATRSLVDLWTASATGRNPDRLVEAYENCVTAAKWAFAPEDQTNLERFLGLVLRQAAADRDKLPATCLAALKDACGPLLQPEDVEPVTDLQRWVAVVHPAETPSGAPATRRARWPGAFGQRSPRPRGF